ncbi:hypothetical protein [Clostridium formicaceticum]|uniref:Uncharacterized protein n=1 Tax=Clostridium formicaceticum TaxID=1497 RepID=A0AAC9RNU7_9CLOT|nr:hypothetical protein [Clostridium formicaceticum]AOY77149.1 hypothetical protein BJL90_15610 [Clostridium formicaceticum]ARE87665.1 hypothetical protein CLFO_20650 [Clostridium formicaceticum]
MPDYFWNWYIDKGYNEILEKELCFKNQSFLIGCCIEYLVEKELCFKNQSFLIGCCIEYLVEKGQKINKIE